MPVRSSSHTGFCRDLLLSCAAITCVAHHGIAASATAVSVPEVGLCHYANPGPHQCAGMPGICSAAYTALCTGVCVCVCVCVCV